MNKKLSAGIFAVACFSACALAFTACGSNSNNNKTPPKASSDMLSPSVISFGTYMSWDETEGADVYEIYRNGVVAATQADTLYRIGKAESDARYCVVAKNSKTGEKSEKSNEITVSKNCDFTQTEILDLTNANSYSSNIPSYVRKVIIGGENRSAFGLSAVLEDRTSDIVFELYNADITGYVVTANYSYKRADNDYNVIFKVTGNCTFKGEDGYDGFDYSDSVYDNMEIDAGAGSDGGGVLIASSVVVCGSGNFTLSGGNGGDGGVGSSTTKWEAVNGPGAGADGGDGGTAVKCAYLVADMDDADNSVYVLDGIGGKKGKPGTNGSIITGPPASAMWKDMYDIGKNGKDGKSVIGVKKIIKGKIVI